MDAATNPAPARSPSRALTQLSVGLRRSGSAWRRVVEAGLVGAVAVGLAAWALRLWGADLGLPLRYAPVDDGKFYLMLVKGIIDHGSYLSNHALGAPFGQQLADFPQGADNLNLLLIAGLGAFSSNAALVENVFFLLTFALTAAAAHLVLRALGVRVAAAGVASLLFALLPYHFFRGESQLLLSAYYAVPLAAYLFLEVLAGRVLFSRRDGRGRSRLAAWASERTLATVVICVVIGSDNLYYAIFAAIMLVGAIVSSLIAGRLPAALGAVAAAGLIAAVLAANLAPSLIYELQNGANPRVARSAAADQSSNEALSLLPASLVLPPPNDRIEPLARLANGYDTTIAPGYCEACYASLGVVGSVGLAWLAVCGLGTLVGAGVWYGGRRRVRHAMLGVSLAFAIGVTGGISTVVEDLVTPDIRAWNRISVLIAFFCFYAVAVLLDCLARRLRPRRRGRPLAALALGAVLAFGVYEQTSPSDAPSRTTDHREYRSDATFVGAIQARLPPGASVFQLPYVPFPEGYPSTPCCGPVPTYATKYESLRGYLHSTTLRWSYGAIKGRPADWSAQLAGQPLSYLLAAVAASGFDGLWVDPAGFYPAAAQRIRAALLALLRQAPLVSPDHDLYFLDLRPYAARLRAAHSRAMVALLRRRTLHPLRAVCAAGGVGAINPTSSSLAVTLEVHTALGATDVRRLTLAPGTRWVTIAGRVRYATLTDDRLLRLARSPDRAGRLVVGLTGPGCPG